jgi:hypothetical protein
MNFFGNSAVVTGIYPRERKTPQFRAGRFNTRKVATRASRMITWAVSPIPGSRTLASGSALPAIPAC